MTVTDANPTRSMQYFSDQYLLQCRSTSLESRVKFLEEMRLLAFAAPEAQSVLISLRVGSDLLKAFKARCKKEGVPYQTKIKQLMRQSLGW